MVAGMVTVNELMKERPTPFGRQHVAVVLEREARGDRGDVEYARTAGVGELGGVGPRVAPSAFNRDLATVVHRQRLPRLRGGEFVGGKAVALRASCWCPTEDVATDDQLTTFLDRGGWPAAARHFLRREVDSAVHQPETASWSLSRSDEIRRPAVGMVHRMTRNSSARWVMSLPTSIRQPAWAAMVGRTTVGAIDCGGHQRALFGVRAADVPDHDRQHREHDDRRRSPMPRP